MRPPSFRIAAVAVWCCAGASLLPAQTTSWLHAAAGVEQSAQRNPGESPYAYSGWGPMLTLGYGRESPRTALDFSVGGAYARLRSDVAAGDAVHGTVVVSARLLRAIDTPHLGARWMLGAQLLSVSEGSDHFFSTVKIDDFYAYSTLGLGPAVRSMWKRGTATITNELNVPLASLVDFPYSNAKSDGWRVRVRFASLASLQSADDALSYRLGDEDARNVALTYRLSYLRYAFVDTRRFARQSLALTFNVPVRRTTAER